MMAAHKQVNTHTSSHIPVMLREVVEALHIGEKEIFIDGTFGGGGYSRAILSQNKTCRLLSIDCDAEAVERSAALKLTYPERFNCVQGNFANMDVLAKQYGFQEVDGVVLDLGFSSFQIEDAKRGFAFKLDGPLDMRLSQETTQTAASYLALVSLSDLIKTIKDYGEEPFAKQIARNIIKQRELKPIQRTYELVEIILASLPAKERYGRKIHPATKTFQALRIAVNDELNVLKQAINSAYNILKPGGRLVIVSFHSLEDRIVKEAFQPKITPLINRHSPMAKEALGLLWQPMKKGAQKPHEQECKTNLRARSARLRSAIKQVVP